MSDPRSEKDKSDPVHDHVVEVASQQNLNRTLVEGVVTLEIKLA